MSPAALGWLCLALALLPLGAIAGMAVVERYRGERDMWRRWVRNGRCDLAAETDANTRFTDLPPAIVRHSGYTPPTVVLLDEPRVELPEGVEGIPIGTRWPIPYEPRHGEHATAKHRRGYRPKHSLLIDITGEFAAIVAGLSFELVEVSR